MTDSIHRYSLMILRVIRVILAFNIFFRNMDATKHNFLKKDPYNDTVVRRLGTVVKICNPFYMVENSFCIFTENDVM